LDVGFALQHFEFGSGGVNKGVAPAVNFIVIGNAVAVRVVGVNAEAQTVFVPEIEDIHVEGVGVFDEGLVCVGFTIEI